jgi:hypothetical protein
MCIVLIELDSDGCLLCDLICGLNHINRLIKHSSKLFFNPQLHVTVPTICLAN